jgi:hypothetical protein
VPGTYTVFGYSKKLQFEGRSMLDHLTKYVAGVQVITADLTIRIPPRAEKAVPVNSPMPLSNGYLRRLMTRAGLGVKLWPKKFRKS